MNGVRKFKVLINIQEFQRIFIEGTNVVDALLIMILKVVKSKMFWSKTWSKSDKSDKIEARKNIGVQSQISEVRKLALKIGIPFKPYSKKSEKINRRRNYSSD